MVPNHLAEKILMDEHQRKDQPHQGAAHVKLQVTQHYFWPNIDQDIINFVRQCEQCQQNRSRKTNDDSDSTIKELNQIIELNTFGPFATSEKGNKFIITMSDQYTDYTEFVSVPDLSVDVIADCIFSHWISRYGMPK